MSEQIHATPKHHNVEERQREQQAEVDARDQAEQERHLQLVKDRQETLEHDVSETLSHIDQVLGWTALAS